MWRCGPPPAVDRGALLCLALGVTQLRGTATAGETTLTTARQDTAGGAIYARNCRVCHGIRASGGLGPPLNRLPPRLEGLPPEQIAVGLLGLLRNGVPGYMPRFLPEQLSDAEAVELVR